MKKRIGLFLAGTPHGGGKFQYNLIMLEAVAALPEDQYEKVVSFLEDFWVPYLDDYDLPRFQVKPGSWGRALFQVWRRSRLPMEWWRAINPIFHPVAKGLLQQHCHLWIFPAEDTWAYQVKVPAVVAIHDLMHRYERHFSEVSANGEYERREQEYRQLCRWALGILVDSEEGKKQLLESYGRNPDSVYPLPFVAPKYLYAGSKGETDLGYHGLPEKFLFYPAQFWEHKNHKRLIQAVALLQDKHPDIHLVFTGSPKNAYEAVVELTENLRLQERVHFLGYVPDGEMAAIYRRARALVMPTFFGPTDIPPLEAIGLGCPVAISDIYGMREQLGEAALYFNPESVAEMAQIMERLWEDDALCQELARRGFIRTAQWTQSHFNERLRQIIDSMLGPKRENLTMAGPETGAPISTD
jgi:glycosyltransferase involved in cell wall biosynthesis